MAACGMEDLHLAGEGILCGGGHCNVGFEHLDVNREGTRVQGWGGGTGFQRTGIKYRTASPACLPCVFFINHYVHKDHATTTQGTAFLYLHQTSLRRPVVL